MKKQRRAYIVTVDVDGVPGWNDRDRPDDMRTLIERSLPEWYRPQVEYVGDAPELDATDPARRTSRE